MSSRPLPSIGLLAGIDRLQPRAGATTVVAVDGRAGAGKSTLARAMAAARAAPVVPLEDLYGGWDGLEAGIAQLVGAVLEPLARGERALVPRYDWLAQAWREPWSLRPPRLLIVEGVGAGALAAAPFVSLLVWVELAAGRRRQRAMARDGALWEGGHWERWAALEDAYLERDRPHERAALVLAGER